MRFFGIYSLLNAANSTSVYGVFSENTFPKRNIFIWKGYICETFQWILIRRCTSKTARKKCGWGQNQKSFVNTRKMSQWSKSINHPYIRIDVLIRIQSYIQGRLGQQKAFPVLFLQDIPQADKLW